MKSKILFVSILGLTIPFISACNNNINHVDAAHNISVNLVLGQNGLYNGQKGQNNDELFLENYVLYEGISGEALPGKDVITSTSKDVEFTSWIIYDGEGTPKVIDELSNDIDGEILYAFYSYTGNYSDIGGSDVPPDPPVGDLTRIYFQDASWWNQFGASTYIYLWGDSGYKLEWPGEKMNAIEFVQTGVDSEGNPIGYNYWYIDIDLEKYDSCIFSRRSGDGSEDWGAQTIDIDLALREENNLYTILDSEQAWTSDGNKVEGTWSIYSNQE